MKRRVPRAVYSRRAARWARVGMVACGLLLAAFVLNIWVPFAVSFNGYLLGVARGCLMAGWSGNSWTGFGLGHAFPIRQFFFHPVILRTDPGCFALVPIWLLLLTVGIPTFIAWRRSSRPPADHCQKCSYNLTGNVSGTCPECGTRIDP